MAIVTKAQQVEHYLRTEIINGKWMPGELLPSEHQLVSKLGVSRTTLRLAISALANEGLVTPHQGLGNFVSAVPGTGIVAMIARAENLASTTGFYQKVLLEEAGRLIESSGYRPVLSIGQGKTEEEFLSSTNLMDMSAVKNVIGVISYLTLGSEIENYLEARGIPVVTVDVLSPVGEHCILLDYPYMIELAVKALRDQGYDDFAIMRTVDISLPKYRTDSRADSESNICRAAAGYRDDRLITVNVNGNDFSPVYNAFKEWWKSPDRPNAIFFTDDNVCDIACRAILELGIKVPEELAIITHANTGRDFHFPIDLTRLEFDPAEVSVSAWKMLDTLITGKELESMAEYICPVLKEGDSLG